MILVRLILFGPYLAALIIMGVLMLVGASVWWLVTGDPTYVKLRFNEMT